VYVIVHIHEVVLGSKSMAGPQVALKATSLQDAAF
jgi:hypothetical protein